LYHDEAQAGKAWQTVKRVAWGGDDGLHCHWQQSTTTHRIHNTQHALNCLHRSSNSCAAGWRRILRWEQPAAASSADIGNASPEPSPVCCSRQRPQARQQRWWQP